MPAPADGPDSLVDLTATLQMINRRDHRSRMLLASALDSGFSTYCNVVRSPVDIRTSAGIPGTSCFRISASMVVRFDDNASLKIGLFGMFVNQRVSRDAFHMSKYCWDPA